MTGVVVVPFLQYIENCAALLPAHVGLDIDTDQIMEVACVVTDDQLNVVAEVV